ncbi:transposon polyprotein integrase, putative [Candida dubliniensis CD36]|uniref:Transposon polyprotein integrase, putative n=1 Tax=Candida dubliniensis (strain CD36 / ATCC MYA-646 / CBS 7987 / NCPF 3949 / NRRL Y-17841) TaxID=573826 RepID=B9WM63_CANDC|nr:transposon polyprotein integrase, putative [Candida dubliniensis CD36]CAX40176.1 transposon polyprotein integrase, putative [Candida dubliniensis CD36]
MSTPTPTTPATAASMGGDGQLQVMSLYNIFTGLTIPSEYILSSKANFTRWRKNFITIAEGVSENFGNYVKDVPLAAGASANNLQFNKQVDLLLQLSVDKEILREARTLGSMGKALYSEIVEEYSQMFTIDKVQVITSLWDKLLDSSVDIKKRLVTQKEFFQFWNSLTADEHEGILPFVWLHLSKSNFNSKYLEGFDPSLTVTGIKRFLTLHPEVNQTSGVSSLPVNYINNTTSSTIQITDANVEAKFRYQCFNCFGLGHTSSKCASPRRGSIKIPNLEKKLDYYRQKKVFNRRRGGTNADESRIAETVSDSLSNSTKFTSTEANKWSNNQGSKNANVIIVSSVESSTNPTSASNFIIDTGASVNLCNDVSLLHDYTHFSEPHSVVAANGESLKVFGHGTLKFNHNSVEVEILYVGFAPNVAVNLLNPKSLIRGPQDSITLSHEGVVHSTLGKIGTFGDTSNCVMSPIVNPMSAAICAVLNRDQVATLHHSFGHPNATSFKKMLDSAGHVAKTADIKSPCDSCLQTKNFQSFPKASDGPHTKTPLQIIHLDVAGPFGGPAVDLSKVFLVIVDDFSRHKWVFPLQSKSDATEVIINWIRHWERYFAGRGEYKVSSIRSDNGGEFLNQDMSLFCLKQGIRHERTIPYNSHQNGKAERAIRSIMDKSRTLLCQSGLPSTFWCYSTIMAAHLLNITPSEVLNYQTSYEKWYGSAPKYSKLHPFGSTAYAHVPTTYRSKLQPNGVKCIFLGYPQTQSGYLLYDIQTKTIVVAKDVKFVDSEFLASSIDFSEINATKLTIPGVTRSSTTSETFVPSRTSQNFPTEPTAVVTSDEIDIIDNPSPHQSPEHSPVLTTVSSTPSSPSLPPPPIVQEGSEYEYSSDVSTLLSSNSTVSDNLDLVIDGFGMMVDKSICGGDNTYVVQNLEVNEHSNKVYAVTKAHKKYKIDNVQIDSSASGCFTEYKWKLFYNQTTN